MQGKQTVEQDIRRAAQIIKNGGVVVYPTETAYGLGVDATNSEALAKLYALKNMPSTKPTHIALLDIQDANKYAYIDERAIALAKAFLPGPLTLVLPAREILFTRLVNQTDKSVGIRIPNNPATLRLLELVGVPITATSANKHRFSTTYSVEEIKKSFGDDFTEIDYVLDAGELPHTAPSTLVSLVTLEPKILREGPISLEEIMRIISTI